MGRIQTGPHYEIPSTEFAKWLERDAAASWWNVDGDPLLTGRLAIPCPSDELASELRELDRPILIEAKGESTADGQVIDASRIGSLARFAGNPQTPGTVPSENTDRFFDLCWKGSPHEWLLIEDSVSAKQFLEESVPESR